jgi:hypothetical protein
MLAKNDPPDFQNNNTSGRQNDPYADLVKSLLYEIIRVKKLIKNSAPIPNKTDQSETIILNELVTEAYQSLTNYDIVLMKKYYDLLLNCD